MAELINHVKQNPAALEALATFADALSATMCVVMLSFLLSSGFKWFRILTSLDPLKVDLSVSEQNSEKTFLSDDDYQDYKEN